jgi:cytochrome c
MTAFARSTSNKQDCSLLQGLKTLMNNKALIRSFATLMLLTGSLVPGLVSAAPDKPKGDAVFRQRCQMCHSAEPKKPSTIGPMLAGVVGRKAGALPFAYSPAMKQSAVTWTRPNLDRYLSGPGKMIPGTRMVISVSNAAERAAVIDFLSKTR